MSKLGNKLIDLAWKYAAFTDKRRIARQALHEGVECVCDIKYINDNNPMHTLDVYYPKGTNTKLPVIFDIHGGGWTYGAKHLNKNFCMTLALEGFVVININYRLLTEVRFIEQLRDVFAALNWMEKRYDDYFIDLENVFVAGDSAGGHLASFVMALQNNPELSQEWELQTNIKVKAGALICPAVEMKKFLTSRNPFSNSYGEYFLGKEFRTHKWLPKASFSGVYNGKMPPVYLVGSSKDFLKGQTKKAIEFFDKNNVEYKLKFWQGKTKNKLTHVFQVLFPEYEESIETNKEMCEFFKNKL